LLALSLYLRVLPSPNYIDRRGLCIAYINGRIVWVQWDGYQQICLWVSGQLLYKYMAKWLRQNFVVAILDMSFISVTVAHFWGG
jgi:hypothetical protein